MIRCGSAHIRADVEVVTTVPVFRDTVETFVVTTKRDVRGLVEQGQKPQARDRSVSQPFAELVYFTFGDTLGLVVALALFPQKQETAFHNGSCAPEQIRCDRFGANTPSGLIMYMRSALGEREKRDFYKPAVVAVVKPAAPIAVDYFYDIRCTHDMAIESLGTRAVEQTIDIFQVAAVYDTLKNLIVYFAVHIGIAAILFQPTQPCVLDAEGITVDVDLK